MSIMLSGNAGGLSFSQPFIILEHEAVIAETGSGLVRFHRNHVYLYLVVDSFSRAIMQLAMLTFVRLVTWEIKF